MNLSEFKSNNGNFMIKGRQIEPTKIPHINTIEVGDSCNVNSVDMCVHSHIVPKKEIEKSFPIPLSLGILELCIQSHPGQDKYGKFTKSSPKSEYILSKFISNVYTSDD